MSAILSHASSRVPSIDRLSGKQKSFNNKKNFVTSFPFLFLETIVLILFHFVRIVHILFHFVRIFIFWIVYSTHATCFYRRYRGVSANYFPGKRSFVLSFPRNKYSGNDKSFPWDGETSRPVMGRHSLYFVIFQSVLLAPISKVNIKY